MIILAQFFFQVGKIMRQSPAHPLCWASFFTAIAASNHFTTLNQTPWAPDYTYDISVIDIV